MTTTPSHHLKNTPANLRTALQQYATPESPMGPIDAARFEDSEVNDVFFQAQNKIYEQLSKSPSFIVGRKGSGKTAFLHSLRHDSAYCLVVPLETAEPFRGMVQLIQRHTSELLFPEAVAKEWEKLFWLALLNTAIQLENDHPDIKAIKRFFLDKGIRPANSADDLFARLASNEVQRRQMGFLPGATWTLEDAKTAFLNYLLQSGTKAAVLLDSLEGFRLDIGEFSHALSGFLRAVSSFEKPSHPCTVRACLPAEMYHVLEECSANPAKDFHKRALLHWHASELVQVLAHRLRLYYELHHPETAKRLLSYDINTNEGAKELFHHIFPVTVTNGLGVAERTLGYILRHTQLLPRHLLQHVNMIFGRVRNRDLIPIEPKAIVDGIRAAESVVCQDIIKAYKSVYPEANRVLAAAVPNLPFTFEDSILHKVFNRHVKRVFPDGDFHVFKRMLVEMGVIGHVIDKSQIYTIGLFEYTVPNMLHLGASASMCLHPVFVETFNAIRPIGSQPKAVYPYGTDIDGDDHRDF